MTLPKEINPEEKSAIDKLRVRMNGSLTPQLSDDPSLFYRFLKARDFDVDKAEKMILKHIHWRKVHQIDTILDDMKPKEYFCRYISPSTIGFDKDGDTVLYTPTGKLDINDMLKCDKINNYVRSFIWYIEKRFSSFKEHNKKAFRTGKKYHQTTFILDLDKLAFSNVIHKASAETWLSLTRSFQDNYPECLKAMYVINAPSYYVFLFSMLKATMSNAMIQKIHVFGQNGWKEELLNVIDADVLPAFLGGNRTDPDGNPLCVTFVGHGGKFSPEYYLSNKDRHFKDISQVQSITIPHSDRKEIYLNITEKGCIIKWEYLVKSKDVGFGLSFQESEQNTIEVIPIERYSTVDGTEEGFYKSQSIGKYIIIFDNSHSWMSSKEIQYCVAVIKPE